MAFFGPEDIAHDSTLTVEGADGYLFGILSSEIFTTWLSTVGGRIKSDFRLSAEVVYNTFPFPDPTDQQRNQVRSAAQQVLQIRERYPTATLADLYDPRAMPGDLTTAHAALDQAVRRLFQPRAALATELARQEELLARYADATAGMLPPSTQRTRSKRRSTAKTAGR